MTRPILPALLLSIAIPSAAFAQPVRGRVVDEEFGEAIAGVPIRVEGTEVQTFTDEHGDFVFEQLPAGDLSLVAEGDLIEATRVTLGAAARTAPVLIRARYADLPEYTVTVIGTRARPQTASTSRITARELASVPRRNAEDALRLVPGLTLVQHGSEGKGHQFFLRGFDAVHGADLELSVEGIPVNEWSNIHAQGYIELGFVIPEVIQSVEVTKGPFTLDQGAFAMAGSADYQLGVPEADRGLRAMYTIGTTNRHRGLVSYSPRDGDGEDFIAGELMHDDGFGQRRAIDRSALLGRWRLVDDPEHGSLSLLASGYLARFDLPGTLREEDVQAGRIDFYDAYDHGQAGLSSRALLALSHLWGAGAHTLSSRLYGSYRRLRLLENYTGYLIDATNGDRRKQRQAAWSFGATVDYDLQISDRLSLEAGLGLRGDVLDQSQQHVDAQEAPLEAERDLRGIQLMPHLQAGLRFRPNERWRLAAGVRVDLAYVSVVDALDDDLRSTGARAAISPRATVQWRPLAAWRLFAAYGRGFRPPEARSFTSFEPARTGISEEVYDGGDPSMTVADAFELGTRWLPSRYFGGALSGFSTFIQRESVFDHVSGINLELNRTRRLGVELELHSSPIDGLSLNADITYVDARFVGSGNPIPLAPSLVGGFRASYTHDSGLRAGLRFFGLAPRPLPHGARGAAMGVLDATAGYTWRALRIDLEVENILNQQIREGEYHYASHWQRGSQSSEIPVLHYVAGPPLNARLSLSAVF